MCCAAIGAVKTNSTALDSFVAEFRSACASGDIHQLQHLVWWGKTTSKVRKDIETELGVAASEPFLLWKTAPSIRRDIEVELAQAISKPIVSIQVGLLPREYRRLKEMREASLPVTHELFVRYGPLENTRFFLGRHQGRFYIVVYPHRVRIPQLLAHPQ